MHFRLDGGTYAIPDSLLCLDASTDKQMTIVGAQMRGSECTKYTVRRRSASTWEGTSVCSLPGAGVTTTTGEVRGDLRRAYTVVADGVTSGGETATRNSEHRIVIQAQRVGSCPSGQTGGDVTVGGHTRNALR